MRHKPAVIEVPFPRAITILDLDVDAQYRWRYGDVREVAKWFGSCDCGEKSRIVCRFLGQGLIDCNREGDRPQGFLRLIYALVDCLWQNHNTVADGVVHGIICGRRQSTAKEAF